MTIQVLFMSEKYHILIKILLEFVCGLINNNNKWASVWAL